MARCHVTALAEEGDLGDEEALVVGPVRVVAGHAGVDDRGVLPQVRPAFLAVAARAGIVDRRAHLQQLDVGRSVRVVARRTRELPFANRHVIEARLLVHDVPVAGRAQLRLGRRFELLLALGGVDAVARHAPDVALVVLAAREQRVGSPRVARQADLARPLWHQILRIDDLVLVDATPGAAAHMTLSWTMAGLAALPRRWTPFAMGAAVRRGFVRPGLGIV